MHVQRQRRYGLCRRQRRDHNADTQSGVITAVTYRDGHVCRLPTPTPTGVKAASCPYVGDTHYPPFHPPHITAARTTTPVTVHAYVANRLCYRPQKHGFDPIAVPCDHGVPHGYKLGNASPGRSLLINITFTAPLAATNQHRVYEWSFGRTAGPSCPVGGGSVSATTMTPIHAGQHVMIQDNESPCPGTYNGLVTYQPTAGPDMTPSTGTRRSTTAPYSSDDSRSSCDSPAQRPLRPERELCEIETARRASLLDLDPSGSDPWKRQARHSARH